MASPSKGTSSALSCPQLEPYFQGITVEVTHLVLETGLVQGFAISRDREPHLHVRHSFDAHGNLQRTLRMLDEPSTRGKASGPKDRNATRPPLHGGLARCRIFATDQEALEPFPPRRSFSPGRGT